MARRYVVGRGEDLEVVARRFYRLKNEHGEESAEELAYALRLLKEANPDLRAEVLPGTVVVVPDSQLLPWRHPERVDDLAQLRSEMPRIKAELEADSALADLVLVDPARVLEDLGYELAPAVRSRVRGEMLGRLRSNSGRYATLKAEGGVPEGA